MKLLVFGFLAACGGGAKAPATTITEGDPADLGLAVDAAPPEDRVDELELRADRACACTDDGCRGASLTSLHELDGVRFERSERLRDAQHRIVTCLEAVLDPLLMTALEALAIFRISACACEDDDCATSVARELLAWMEDADTPTAAILASHPLVTDQLEGLLQCSATLEFDR